VGDLASRTLERSLTGDDIALLLRSCSNPENFCSGARVLHQGVLGEGIGHCGKPFSEANLSDGTPLMSQLTMLPCSVLLICKLPAVSHL